MRKQLKSLTTLKSTVRKGTTNTHEERDLTVTMFMRFLSVHLVSLFWGFSARRASKKEQNQMILISDMMWLKAYNDCMAWFAKLKEGVESIVFTSITEISLKFSAFTRC